MSTHDRFPTAYRVRTVRVGLQATWLTLALLALYPFLPGSDPRRPTLYWATLATAAAGALVVAILPWDRLFARGRGMLLMYAWSVLDIVLVTSLVVATGGHGSPMFVLYALTTIFFAASYPRAGQALLLAFSVLAYLAGVALGGSAVNESVVALRAGVLIVIAFLGSFLSRELSEEVAAHVAARTQSDRRAKALAAVADAAKSMSSLSSDHVLESVVESAKALGYDGVAVCLLDRPTMTYRIVHPRGLPEDFVAQPHSAGAGLVGAVLRRGKTTVPSEDHQLFGRAYPELHGMGFLCAAATPVFSDGRIEAVLAAASREKQAVSPSDVEALELLAGHAGRALENARRFEHERQALRRMEELDRFKRDFIDSASHEIRTPLTVIRGLGLTMERRWETLDDDTRRELMDRLNTNAGILSDIVSSLLDFSRLDDSSQVRQERTPLAPLVQRVAGRLAALLDRHDLSLRLEPGLFVRVDPVLIERVIENLLVNAARHTPPGTRVKVSARADVAGAEVAVADDGPGIASDDLAYLGERFYRGGDPNDRPTRGAGLGLALAKEILSLHDTHLEVDSRPGKGARFSFRLPLDVADRAASV